MRRPKRKGRDEASFDLTPMIDCVFQLLIFFIVCTKFMQRERDFRTRLPDDEGQLPINSPPKEQLTVYCSYDTATGANQYVLAIGARNRKVVPDTRATLGDLVILDRDRIETIRDKKALYGRIHGNLTRAIHDYVRGSGANIQKIEISFALDPTVGARSGTAPWCFVSLAIDSVTQFERDQGKVDADGHTGIPICYKFTDSR